MMEDADFPKGSENTQSSRTFDTVMEFWKRFFGSAHISEFQAVAAQFPEVADVGWRDKGRHDKIHPEHARDVDGISEIGLLAFGLLYVFWVGQDRPEAALFQDVEHLSLIHI